MNSTISFLSSPFLMRFGCHNSIPQHKTNTGKKRGEAEEKTKEGKKGHEMLVSVVLTLNK
jgi:hypothetical protein